METVIHKESDIIIEVTFQDTEGNSIAIPSYDFDLEYYIYPERSIKAGVRNGQLYNCSADDNKLIIALDKPNLGSGELRCKRTIHVPDENFPDGIRTIVTKTIAGVKIW